MSRNAGFAAALAALSLCVLPTGSPGQSIEGRVLLAGWLEPVHGARVQLLGTDLMAISATRTDDEGRFAFPALEPGTYYVQAIQGEVFSSVAGPIEAEAGAEAVLTDLTMRSALFEQAVTCLTAGARPGVARAGAARSHASLRHGVLAGLAYDAGTETPLPGARIRVQWRDDHETASELLGEADGAGRFVLCDVPAGVTLSVWVEALGRASQREEGVQVEAGSVARLDIPVLLGGTPSLRVLGSETLRPDAAATLEGRLLDSETESPIAAAVVRLAGLERSEITDAAGRFRFTGVPPGQHAFEVHRLGYDWESGPIEVGEGTSILLELRASPRAIALDAVVVRASSVETRMARAATQAPRVIAGDRLRDAEQRTAPVAEVARQFPSLAIREGRFETSDGVEYGVCIESSRAMHRYAVEGKRTELPWCEMIAVVIDGVTTIRASEMLHTLRVYEIESIEFLPPIGALRWGERAAINGALVIWTRGRGPHRDPSRDGG